MNRMYRHQRHFYDLTRKFYLLGRDGLLEALPCAPGMTICEIGAGTGRNLIRLARRSSGVRLYGIDASRVMLATAKATIERAGIAEQVDLAEATVEAFDPMRSFGIDKFDVVYISYVLSMVPDWRRAVTRAIDWVRPGGTLAVVDFSNQAQASPLRRRLLLAWLAVFDVHPCAEIERELRTIARAIDQCPHHRSLARGYAYQLLFRIPHSDRL